VPCLDPKDVSDAVIYVLGAPPHVQVRQAFLCAQTRLQQGHRVHVCGENIASLLPYRNSTKNISANIQFRKNISYFKILIILRTYITYNENIASFNVLHKPFIRICQLL
jgi:hypothetical protein